MKSLPSVKQTFLPVLMILIIPAFSWSYSGDIPAEILDMSLEELMQVKIYSGSITGTERINAPVSHTEITREMIEHSSARDLLDILEIYVPGFTYVNHFMGPRIGMRGLLGDQNYSYLLLVNGRNMNLRMLHGPLYELENRELSDIERIDVIHGPGSVTYGPGAIGGVINIITRSSEYEIEGLQVYSEGNLEYRYVNTFLQYSNTYNDLKVLANASISRSQGLKDSKYYYVCWADNCGYGFMNSDWGGQGYGSDAPKMFEDFDDQPQYKINLEMIYKENLRTWLRLTTFSHTKLIQEGRSSEGPAFSGIKGQSLIAATEYDYEINEKTKLKSSIGFDSKSYRDHSLAFGSNLSFDDIRQRTASFSENISSGKVQLNYSYSERSEIAFGSEYEYQWYGPEWGKGDNTFVYRFQNPLQYVVLDSSSAFNQYMSENYSSPATVIKDNINGYLFSFFSEGNFQPTDKTKLLISGRADKHGYADWAFSPRIAMMYNLNKYNHFSIVAQQSVRLQLFSDLYTEDKMSGSSAETEELRGLELSYRRIQSDNLTFKINGFYNTVDQIVWLSNEEQAGLIGTFESMGLEIEGTYTNNRLHLGTNYSYVEQLSWDPVVPTEAYLSLIGPDLIDVYLKGYATNRMNNTPRHSFKFFYDQKLPQNVHLHLDGRVYWGYGQIDMLDQFLEAHNNHGIELTKNTMQAIYDDMRDYGYTRPSFTSNVHLSWKLPVTDLDAKISLYAMNLLAYNHIRYVIQYWGAGNQRHYPRQCSFVEEPLNFGITLNVKI